MISSIFGLLTESYYGDEMTNKKGGKCSMYGDKKNVNMVVNTMFTFRLPL